MSLPTYPDVKDSGIEWVGNVPSHWVPQPLFALVSERNQSNAGMIEDNLLSLSYGRIVRKDIDNNDGLLPASFETYQIVEPNDMVWRLTDLQNDQRSLRTALVSERGIITSAYLATQPRRVFPAFLGYLLRAYDLTKVFYSMGGGLRQSMKFADVKRLPVMLPPEDEQVTISAFLDRETAKIDALIEEQRRLVALLKEKRQAVISHAVTKGLDSHASMKDSGIEWLGEVPAHWKVRRIKTVLDHMEQGWSPQCEAEPVDSPEQWGVLKVGCVNGGQFNPAENKTLPTDLEPIPALSIRAGDILVSRANTRELVGSASLVEHDHHRLLLCDKLYRLGVKPAEIEAGFLAVYLQADVARGQIEVAATGASSSMVNIGQFVIREMPIATPPIQEQRDILAHLHRRRTAFDALIAEAGTAVLLLSERRASLISAAVTGKIDVRQSAKILPFPIDRARARRFVATEIIERLAHQPTFGRTKLQKVAYLAETHAKITELAGCYIRMPFGPLDQPMMDEIEATGSDDGIAIDDKRDGSMVRYRVTGTKGRHTADLRNWLGEERFTKLDHLIKVLSGLKTHSAEAIATLYAVWNDALIEGRSLTDEQIFSAFFSWHPKKGENFRADELPHWLDWMRRHGIVPTGSGSKTMSQTGTLL